MTKHSLTAPEFAQADHGRIFVEWSPRDRARQSKTNASCSTAFRQNMYNPQNLYNQVIPALTFPHWFPAHAYDDFKTPKYPSTYLPSLILRTRLRRFQDAQLSMTTSFDSLRYYSESTTTASAWVQLLVSMSPSTLRIGHGRYLDRHKLISTAMPNPLPKQGSHVHS